MSSISLESISKCYRIFDNPRDRLRQALFDRLPFHLRARGQSRRLYREHWALYDVNMRVDPGEVVAIIGRNGAGKSTLLQIIAGTLEPTGGQVRTTGRITALLELGSGFNPEFTGRENVFLNAQILGLSNEEVAARFHDIVRFADIGDFIDQPMKTYSSGMMMRLAFAVQTGVDPKVLIVDEALSVGDMFFQAKCMTRLRHLMSQGVTILFVSHDVGVVRQLCDRAILLSEGKVLDDGPVKQVTDHYQRLDIEDYNRRAPEAIPEDVRSSHDEPDGEIGFEPTPKQRHGLSLPTEWLGDVARFRERATKHRSGNGMAEVLNVTMLKDGLPSDVFDFGDVVTLRLVVRFNNTLDHVNVGYKIRTLQGVGVVFGGTPLHADTKQLYTAGHIYVFDWQLKLPLMHGSYMVETGLAQPPGVCRADWVFLDVVPTCLTFTVTPRKEGMIDGFVALESSLNVREFRN
ncbi:sugar ABC transporter ATP-binding protein [Nitrospira sp. KM1]|uniref:ABC transporter ATP-binding protein n=1 Tax=Nitrospira sp. KM1 TaxID=1936990 RepID=UPI0013A71544|nr:ABC transporter ATP-binding protein [Nitrospira sp. KM1]BCA54226.1 sugar ABC transporter ATP-binding protein [Nitrospira sp. KM1]